jgi:hypothetical protein
MLNHGRRHREAVLDEALEETFPASDPLGLREVLAFAMTLGGWRSNCGAAPLKSANLARARSAEGCGSVVIRGSI